MIRTITAATLAFLALTAPAHAGFGTVEDVNLNFYNGYQAIGELNLVTAAGTSAGLSPAPTLYHNLTPLGVVPVFGEESGHLFYGPPGSAPFGTYDLAFIDDPAFFVPTNFTDFSLNGLGAFSGTVTCVSEDGSACTTPFPSAPLPPALPLFASGIAALGAIAWRRRGKLSTVRQ